MSNYMNSKIYKMQYYQNNKEYLKFKSRQYRQDNDVLLKQKHNCECGGKYTHQHIARHLKSKLHREFEKLQEIEFYELFGLTPDITDL